MHDISYDRYRNVIAAYIDRYIPLLFEVLSHEPLRP